MTDPVRCRDRCGREEPSEDAATKAGWTCLSIAGGWRCGVCDRVLFLAGSIVGTDEVTADPLPPGSRGALPKETASTISPPTKGLS